MKNKERWNELRNLKTRLHEAAIASVGKGAGKEMQVFERLQDEWEREVGYRVERQTAVKPVGEW